jgi:hypothetical protein
MSEQQKGRKFECGAAIKPQRDASQGRSGSASRKRAWAPYRALSFSELRRRRVNQRLCAAPLRIG